jgi:hypothetical protein
MQSSKITVKFRIHIGLVVFGLLILSLSLLQPIQTQYTPDGQPFILVSPISIDSPANITYSTNQVCLNVTVKSLVKNDADTTMVYSIDGNDNVTILTSEKLVPVWVDVTYANGTKTKEISSILSYFLISGLADLENLQQGQHNLTVFARYEVSSMQKIAFDNQTVYFTIDDGSLPVVSNVHTDDGVPKFEASTSIIYAFVGVFSLITVVSYALFTKLRHRNKI